MKRIKNLIENIVYKIICFMLWFNVYVVGFIDQIGIYYWILFIIIWVYCWIFFNRIVIGIMCIILYFSIIIF